VDRYWQFLVSLFVGLVFCEFLLSSLPSLYQWYSSAIGFIGLGVEATLPIPQILANAKSRSCKGFRLSVLASWLIGDSMKMFWFFTSTTSIPLAFKVCGMFQAMCDTVLGVQYMVYGDGEASAKAHPSPAIVQLELQPNGFTTASGHAKAPGRRTSTSEKSI
jgi:hypothetical protein